MVVKGIVYLERDIAITLEASREMAQGGDSTEEQYRTTNTLNSSVTKICINGPLTGVFGTALDLAIQNYNELPLSFAMARTSSTGCSHTINLLLVSPMVGGSSGFPSGGAPFGTMFIGVELAGFGVDVIEHVITHEIGHTIGFRHSDFFNRAISCGAGGNEGDGGVGVFYVPGTPPDAVFGGSLMNSCFNGTENGEFAASDLTALKTLYGAAPRLGSVVPHVGDNRSFGGNIFAENFSYVIGGACAPGFVRAGTPSVQWTSQVGGFCTFQGWVNPENQHDCRALMLAHTAGGFFGGTCLSSVEQAQNSFAYNTSNTSNATVNTVNQSVNLDAGKTLTVGTCGVTDASFSGDTYLRLVDNQTGALVALNDDACGLGSRLTFTATTSSAFQIRAGCYSSNSCGGTVAWTID